MAKNSFVAKVIFNEILRIKEYWNLIDRELFLAITWEPDFSKACSFCRMSMKNHQVMIITWYGHYMDSQRPKIGDSWSFTSLYLQHWVTTPKKQVVLQNQLKACVCYFRSIFFSPNDSPSKTVKCFLFHLKISFHFWDIQIFVFFTLPFHFFQIQKEKWKWNN